MYEDDRTRGGRKKIKRRDQEEAGGGGVSTWPVSRGIKQSVYRSAPQQRHVSLMART